MLSKWGYMILVGAGMLALLMMSCNDTTTPPPTASDIAATESFEDYTQEEEADGLVRLQKRKANGQIREMGFSRDGQRSGTWTLFSDKPEYPDKVITYRNGLYDGPYMEFNANHQLQLLAHYRDNQLHGPWRQYEYGRIKSSANYDNGVMDGVYLEFDLQGNLLKEAYYNKGQLHGSFRTFDKDGNLLLQYEYDNGEKVSGGVATEQPG